MSRFTQFPGNTAAVKIKKKITTVSVLVRKQDELKSVAEATPARITSALTYLQNSDRLVRMFAADTPPTGTGAETIDKYALAFFKKKISKMERDDISLIQKVITLVTNGLSSNMTLKIGSNPGRDNKHVGGQVSMKANLDGSIQGNKTPVENQRTLNAYFVGTIKIDKDTFLNRKLGVLTLIHEATHKYAATLDYVYFDKDGGITPADDYQGGFDDFYALNNADSYAHFICSTGRLG